MPSLNLLPNETTRATFPWRKRGLVSYGAPFQDLAAAHLQRLDRSRAFALVSGSLTKDSNHLDTLKLRLGEKLVGIHVGFKSHTPWDDVLSLVKEIQASGADVVVTLGGGSITDAVKIAALCLANDIWDLKTLDALSKRLVKGMLQDIDYKEAIDPMDIKPPTVSMINIPTTLSAGEYSPYAGGIDPTDGVKKMFILQSLHADVVILDPTLGSNVPEWAWMSSGVRSIDHCVELLGSMNDIDKQTKEAAEQGLILLSRGLLKLRKDPMDTKSRLDTQLGSNFAMDGLCRGIHLGGSHAIGHQLGTMNVAHGITSCVLMPAVMKYNAPANADRQKRALNAIWSDEYVSQVLSDRGLSPEKNDLSDTLDGLFREFSMPRTLREVKVEGESNLKVLAERSLEDPWCRTNPIPLTKADQVLEILRMVEG